MLRGFCSSPENLKSPNSRAGMYQSKKLNCDSIITNFYFSEPGLNGNSFPTGP